jgi:cytochrome c biogenesis protein CcdA
MWLILVDAMSFTLTFTTVFTLAVAFALCAESLLFAEVQPVLAVEF